VEEGEETLTLTMWLGVAGCDPRVNSTRQQWNVLIAHQKGQGYQGMILLLLEWQRRRLSSLSLLVSKHAWLAATAEPERTSMYPRRSPKSVE